MMKTDPQTELIAEFCHSIFELRYKLRRMFQVKLKETGISVSFEVLEVLKLLGDQVGLNQQDLADLLFKDKSSMTYLIDNMVKAGLVTRMEDEADRRNKLIILTPKAQKLKRQLAPLATDCYLTLAAEVTGIEIKAGITMLAKMNHSLTEFII